MAEGDEARVAAFEFQHRPHYLINEALPGGVDRGDLQFFLRAEVGEEAALRHPELVREAADRQPLQAFDRGEVDGVLEDAGAGALPLHATVRSPRA